MADKRSIVPLAIPPDLDEKITIAAQRLAMPKSEVMRLAMAIGLEHFRRIDYDLAAHLCQTQETMPALKVAEEMGNAGSPSTHADGAKGGIKYPKGRRRKS